MIWFGNTMAVCLKQCMLDFAPFISIKTQIKPNTLVSFLKAITLKLMVLCTFVKGYLHKKIAALEHVF